MTWFEDLSACSELGSDSHFLAIGWLSAERSFAQGDVSPAFFDKLKELVENRFEPVMSVGCHACDLCQFDAPMGAGRLFVPHEGALLVCPELIVHYVAAHRYEPPKVFQEAVMQCPMPRTTAYRKLFLESGGRALMQGD